MKNYKYIYFFLFVVLGISCKKSKQDDVAPNIQVVDNTNVVQNPTVFTYSENVVEQVTQEFTKSISKIVSGGQANIGLCGSKVDTLAKSDSSLVLKYNFDANTVCSVAGASVKQTGTINVTFIKGKDWDTKGAVLQYEFVHFRVIPICDTCDNSDYSVEINGIQKRQNMTGGNEASMLNGDSVVIEIYSRGMTYSYRDKQDRITNQKQRMTLTKMNGETTSIIVGIDTIESGDFKGETNVAFWGLIWNGKPYMVKYEQPKTYKTCNGNGKIVCGSVYSIFKGAYEKRETYGVDPKTGKGYNTCNCTSDTYFLQTITDSGKVETKIYKY